MKQSLLLLLILVFSIPVQAKKKKAQSSVNNYKSIDYTEIEKAISIQSSRLYYPRLLERFYACDSTMTIEEKRHLFYGFIFSDNYSPYGSGGDYGDSVRTYSRLKEYTEADYLKLITFADSVQHKSPFDIDAINAQLFAYRKLERLSDYERKVHQIRIVFDAIFSSGDGLTKESAYFVITPSYEYDVLGILNVRLQRQSLIGHYDCMKLQKNDLNLDALYFDVSASLNYMSSLFSKELLKE